jgi:thiamine-monophosphate kinase
MFENKATTELSSLGEFGLIKHLTQNIVLQNESTLKGVGDDAAVIDNAGLMTVVSTDMLMEGVHFDLGYVPLKHLGYKAVMVNLSDIFAMNAWPRQITVSLALSSKFPLEAVEELYQGMLKACAKWKIDLVGGDTTSSRSGLVISITAIGIAEKNDLVYRNTAREKDLLCVTGDLGGAYAGLLLLEREKEIFKANPGIQPDLDGNDYILERQLKPEARGDVIEMFKEMGLKPTSMIDISDGLASEVLHLCEQSGVGCNLYEEKLPIDPMTFERSRSFNLDPTTCVLNGGEDYELLFTISMEDYDKVKGNPHITVIGHMTDKNSGSNLIIRDGSVYPIQAQGWDAFLKRKEDPGTAQEPAGSAE